MPSDLAAERTLLGAMLLSPESIEAVETRLRPEDFYGHAHRHVYAAILDARADGIHRPDPLIVTDRLRREGHLADVGGASALTELTMDVASTGSGNAAYHGEIIARHAGYRRIIDAATRASAAAYEAAGGAREHDAREPADIVDATMADLGAIASPIQKAADLYQLHEYLRTRSIVRPEWVIPGIIRHRWRVMLVAPEGIGKTMVMRTLATSVAQGMHPFSGEPIPRKTVLMADFENPDDVILEQCMPIENAMMSHPVIGRTYDPDRVWLYHREEGINLRARADRMRFEAAIAEVKPALLCVGPLYKMFRKDGDSDEEATLEVINVLDDLRVRYNLAIVIEHHAGKASGDVRRLDPFGSSLWFRWPELGFNLKPVKPGDPRHIERGRWRMDRVQHLWPNELYRTEPGSMRPWEGGWVDYPEAVILGGVAKIDARLDRLYGLAKGDAPRPGSLFDDDPEPEPDPADF